MLAPRRRFALVASLSVAALLTSGSAGVISPAVGAATAGDPHSVVEPAVTPPPSAGVPLFKMRHKSNGGLWWGTNLHEVLDFEKRNYELLGVEGLLYPESANFGMPVQRWWRAESPSTKQDVVLFVTGDEQPRLPSLGYTYQEISGRFASGPMLDPRLRPFMRFYSADEVLHEYTTSDVTAASLLKRGYQREATLGWIIGCKNELLPKPSDDSNSNDPTAKIRLKCIENKS